MAFETRFEVDAGAVRATLTALRRCGARRLVAPPTLLEGRGARQLPPGNPPSRRRTRSTARFGPPHLGERTHPAATNHPELLGPALFRRFNDVLEYEIPNAALIERSLRARLAQFATGDVVWPSVVASAGGLSYADLARAADEADKAAILDDRGRVTTARLLDALGERKRATLRSLRPAG